MEGGGGGGGRCHSDSKLSLQSCFFFFHVLWRDMLESVLRQLEQSSIECFANLCV